MANNNKNLNSAKKAKNDEFYTRYEDIEKEISHYWGHLKGKWVYSPCDDYRWSEFKNYFVTNFSAMGLTHYTCTNYDIGDGAFRYDYDGSGETITRLDGNGDFRSEECTKIKDECDVIITNPPFSLFREYVAQLMEYEKKFIIIGNGNAVTYKEIFPLIKENKLWLGAGKGMGGKAMEFIVDASIYDASKGSVNRIENGKCYVGVMMCTWFTNIDHTKRNTQLDLYKKYNAEEYPKYDNYDAIECGKVCEIPMDYDGVIGVPITFLDKYCPEQFEIVGCTESEGKGFSNGLWNEKSGVAQALVNGQKVYKRLFIKKKVSENNKQISG